MDLGIQGKVALVTGGSKGIGLAIAEGLLQEGAKVMISSRNQENVDQAVQQLSQISPDVKGFAVDVAKSAEIDELLATCQQHCAGVDILVANAGGPPAGKVMELEDTHWLQAYELTLMANIRLARAVLPYMQSQRWGRLINITSLSIKQPVAGLALSNALRAAVTGFAKTLSSEVAADGITVNNVGPGYTATERLEALLADEAKRQAVLESIPSQRFGTPEEIAAAAVFLASQQAAYITGQTIIADGGVVGSLF